MPDFETIREYRNICQKVNSGMAAVGVLYLIFVPACIFLEYNLYWILWGALGVFFCWIIKEFLLGMILRKRNLSSRCPNCGKHTGGPERLITRCPHCMRRTIRFAKHDPEA